MADLQGIRDIPLVLRGHCARYQFDMAFVWICTDSYGIVWVHIDSYWTVRIYYEFIWFMLRFMHPNMFICIFECSWAWFAQSACRMTCLWREERCPLLFAGNCSFGNACPVLIVFFLTLCQFVLYWKRLSEGFWFLPGPPCQQWKLWLCTHETSIFKLHPYFPSYRKSY